MKRTLLIMAALAIVALLSTLTVEASAYEKDHVFNILQRANNIKSEVVEEMEQVYGSENKEELDEVMNSFEVNEIVAEIVEAESYYQ